MAAEVRSDGGVLRLGSVRFRGAYRCLALSPNNHYIAAAGRTLRIFAADSGAIMREFPWDTFSVAFHPHEDTLVVGCAGVLLVVCLTTGAINETACDDVVRHVRFTPEGYHLIYIAGDGTGIGSKLFVRRSSSFELIDSAECSIFDLDVSPSGHLLATGDPQGFEVFRFDNTQLTLLAAPDINDCDNVVFVDDETIASAGESGAICLFHLNPIREVRRFDNEVPVNCMTVAGQALLTGGDDGVLRLWDWVRGRKLREFRGHSRGIIDVCAFQDGKRIASTAKDRTIRVWDLNDGRSESEPLSVAAVDLSPDLSRLATGGVDGQLRLWSFPGGKLLQVIPVGAPIASLRFAPDGQGVATADIAYGIKIWNTHTSALLKDIRQASADNSIAAIDFHRAGGWLALIDTMGQFGVWDIDSGCILKRAETSFINPQGLRVCPDGRGIAIVWEDGVDFLDWARQESKIHFAAELGRGAALCFSSDGSRFLMLTERWTYGAIQLYELNGDIKQLNTIPFENAPTAVAIAPDNRTLALGMDDGTIRLVDALTEEEQTALAAHVASVSALAFSPDGRYLVSGSDDSTAVIWTLGESR